MKTVYQKTKKGMVLLSTMFAVIVLTGCGGAQAPIGTIPGGVAPGGVPGIGGPNCVPIAGQAYMTNEDIFMQTVTQGGGFVGGGVTYSTRPIASGGSLTLSLSNTMFGGGFQQFGQPMMQSAQGQVSGTLCLSNDNVAQITNMAVAYGGFYGGPQQFGNPNINLAGMNATQYIRGIQFLQPIGITNINGSTFLFDVRVMIMTQFGPVYLEL